MSINTLRIPCRDVVQSEEFYTNVRVLQKVHGSPEEGFVGYQLENANILIEEEEGDLRFPA